MALDQIDVDAQEQQEEGEMTFLEHLEELRWHIIRSLIVMASVGILFFLFHKTLFDVVVFGPTKPNFITFRLICQFSETFCFTPPDFAKIAIGFGESFIMSIKVSFILGFIAAFPYAFWEIWRFVRPGLYDKERKVTRGVVLICSFLFFTGVLFGYFIIAPFAVNFLMGHTIPGVTNTPTLASYLSYLIMFTVPAGAIFELPILAYFLTKIGLLTPEFMRQYRRHSFIIILILAAVVTPPDIFTQFMIGIPLYILYEISIVVSKRVLEREAKEEAN